MLTDLPRVVATMPGDGPLVVFHSWVAAYLSEEEQRALNDQVATLDERRAPCTISIARARSRPPASPTPPSPVRREEPDLATVLVHVAAGRRSSAAGRHAPARQLDPLVA